MGFLDRGDFVVSKIKDPKVSYVEILILKLSVKVYLLDAWFPRSGMHVDNITTNTANFTSHSQVRLAVTSLGATHLVVCRALGWSPGNAAQQGLPAGHR